MIRFNMEDQELTSDQFATLSELIRTEEPWDFIIEDAWAGPEWSAKVIGKSFDESDHDQFWIINCDGEITDFGAQL